jgi:hypothetical protein
MLGTILSLLQRGPALDNLILEQINATRVDEVPFLLAFFRAYTAMAIRHPVLLKLVLKALLPHCA